MSLPKSKKWNLYMQERYIAQGQDDKYTIFFSQTRHWIERERTELGLASTWRHLF